MIPTESVSAELVPAELINYIKNNSNFIIAGHKEPDGDCVGSQLALRSALQRLGKKAIACSAGPFLRSDLKKKESQFANVTDTDSDAKLIIVDCSTFERLGDLQEKIKNLPYAIIDHHSTSSFPSSTADSPAYIDGNAPSCTLMIEKLIYALDLDLTEEEAEHLLFGLCTDTGFFRHLTEKNADVFEAASRMIKKGASPKKCFNLMHGGKCINTIKLLGHTLSSIEQFFDGKLIICHETLEDFNAFGIGSRDSDILSQLLLSVKDVEVIAVIRQECEDSCTVSFRSIEKVDVAKIALSFGGGGHKNAAGLTMQGNIQDVKKMLLNIFSEIFA